MKAAVYQRYGTPDVLEIKELPKPVPKEKEVLVKIHATTVTSGDWRMRKAYPFIVRFFNGFNTPKRNILGAEFSGEIEATGKNVKFFKPGDPVFGGSGTRLGTNAEYICMSEDDAVAHKPSNLDFEEAAAVSFGATTSLYFLRNKGNISSGQKVLIYGASGAVGTYAVQLAKYFGTDVTAVCSSKNMELVKSLGADKVIDYTREDFTESGGTYDLIFDTVGKLKYSKCSKSLSRNGSFLAGAGGIAAFAQMAWTSVFGSKKVFAGMAVEKKEDIVFLKELLEKNKIKPVIDRRYPLEQIAEAHQYAEQGHKKGNLVLTVQHNNQT